MTHPHPAATFAGVTFLHHQLPTLDEEAPRMAMRTIRVRVHGGRLEPLEQLSLPEGAEVSMEFEEPRSGGSPGAVVAAMDSWSDLDPSLFDELEQAIESGKLPVRTEGVFDRVKE